MTIGQSLFWDLGRYSSNRMARAMGAGGCYAFQAFPDFDGMGVRSGVNALPWRDPRDLVELLRDWLRPERDGDREQMRQAAADLARSEWTWERTTEHLLAIVRDLRQRTGRTL